MANAVSNVWQTVTVPIPTTVIVEPCQAQPDGNGMPMWPGIPFVNGSIRRNQSAISGVSV